MLQSRMQLMGRVLVARSPQSEARVNLTKRRRWFADPPADPVEDDVDDAAEDDPTPPVKAPKVGTPEWVKANPDAAYAEIQRLRRVEADERVRNKKPTPPADAPTAEQRIAELELKHAAAERRALVAEIAQELGLTSKQASRLRGETADDLRADAQDLLESFPAPAPDGKPAPKTPAVPRQKETATVPIGGPVAETDAQKRGRLYNSTSSVFDGGGVNYPGDMRDLDGPVGASGES